MEPVNPVENVLGFMYYDNSGPTEDELEELHQFLMQEGYNPGNEQAWTEQLSDAVIAYLSEHSDSIQDPAIRQRAVELLGRVGSMGGVCELSPNGVDEECSTRGFNPPPTLPPRCTPGTDKGCRDI